MTQRVWISELGGITNTGVPEGQAQIAMLPVLARQNLDVTGGVQSSAPFGKSTNYIRIICEVQCAIRGDGVTATASDLLLPSYTAEYFGVTPGLTLSVIAAP
jgi:hypothetical protein